MDLDLSSVEQLVEPSQTRAIADAMQLCAKLASDGTLTLDDILQRIEMRLDSGGLDTLREGHHIGTWARPRRFELAAALNRFRAGAWKQVVTISDSSAKGKRDAAQMASRA